MSSKEANVRRALGRLFGAAGSLLLLTIPIETNLPIAGAAIVTESCHDGLTDAVDWGIRGFPSTVGDYRMFLKCPLFGAIASSWHCPDKIQEKRGSGPRSPLFSEENGHLVATVKSTGGGT